MSSAQPSGSCQEAMASGKGGLTTKERLCDDNCKHKCTECITVGNTTSTFACLVEPHAQPQRVFGALQGGRHIRIDDD